VAVQIPAVDYLVLGDSDTDGPHLQAWRCDDCNAAYFDRRNGCARCFGTSFTRKPVASEGVIKAFTRVERGAKQPFTSVVVDLGDGVNVKANLRGVDDPNAITADFKVRMYTFVAGTDDEGTEAVAFGFEPVGS
jgi:uncharacterized OB-fold protein